MKNMKLVSLLVVTSLLFVGVTTVSLAQEPYRVGTTAVSFLEIGFGSAGSSMGDAYVSMANDLSSIYWNPAGLAYMEKSEAQFTYQPWMVDINTSFAGVGLAIPTVGTLALGIYQVDYGENEVTTLAQQDGTGEFYSANDLAISLSYARKLAQWFGFGATFKYVGSSIWHTKASAIALDMGVLINTQFFSPTGDKADGLQIGMSISNYGTRMKYDGIDLIYPIDLLPETEGNYRDTPGQFKLQGWELPLIFRVGVSLNPIQFGNNKVTVAADALHPNNNSESVNVGGQYELNIPTFGSFFLRGGYKAIFMNESQYGATFGGGFLMYLFGNMALKMDYCYRDIGLLGTTNSYTMGITF